MPIELDRFERVWSTAAGTWEHWLCVFVMGWLAFVSWALWYRTRSHRLERRKDRLLREELETYARLDVHLGPDGDARALARRVVRVVADKSAFRRVALLLLDAGGRTYLAASSGMDELATAALTAWGDRALAQERAGAGVPPGHPDSSSLPHTRLKRFSLELLPEQIHDSETISPSQAILLPLRLTTGRMAGALAVCPQPLLPEWMPTLDEAIPPLEALAAKLARALENAVLTKRLARAEKLAGLGQLAGGVAHELNNPLTAVLGFAELIAETSAEARVRDDARTIVTEALRMREIIQNLVTFWRPAGPIDKAVDVAALVREIAADCGPKLEQRGVALLVAVAPGAPQVRGNADRLRIVLEHLIGNAAQALDRQRDEALVAAQESSGRLPRGEDEPPTIRLTVGEAAHGPARMLHAVVSDTGRGFREPSRVFDPFYTTRQPGEGSGLGLSICYGIVREHGGEISAFNLHPHGAAVVVELPVHTVLADDTEARILLQRTT